MKTQRQVWRCDKRGRWSRTLGERGLRVRLFQKRRGGPFYRGIWIPAEVRWDRCNLRTADRPEAERFGRQLLAELLLGARPSEAERRVTLGALWERFSRQAPRFLDNHAKTRGDAQVRVRMLLSFFGADCDVRELSERDVAAFSAARRAGGIRYVTARGEVRISKPTRARSVEADLVALSSMLNWAVTVRTAQGGRWLDANPLAGIPRPKELNPRRGVATFERYEATRRAMQELAAGAPSEDERTHWVRYELALALAFATGRRLGSIRALEWSHFDFEKRTVRWIAAADKKGREWVVPMPVALLEEVRGFQRRLGAVGGLVFPSARDPSVPIPSQLFDRALLAAESRAELPKLEGTLWHAYRRAWASTRKHLPITDVAFAGGWTRTETLLRAYQRPDPVTLLRVMEEPTKLHEVVGG